MRLDRFDMNLLVVLDVLLEERSVTRAGKRLHIGQSAASAALARLRSHFDDALLVQVGRRLELTPLARDLVLPVRDAMLRARSAISLRPSFDPGSVTRRFAVCASDYIVDVLIGHVARSIAQSAPGIRLDISRPPADILAAFEQGSFDMLIMPEQYANRLQHPQTEVVRDEHVCMMCSETTLDRTSLSMEDYLDSGHVAVRLGDETSLTFEDWFLPRYGQQRRIECTIDQFGAVPLMLIGTNRIATIHRRIAEQMAQRFPVKILPAPFVMEPLREMMVWPIYVDQDLAHQWFRNKVVSAANTLGLNA